MERFEETDCVLSPLLTLQMETDDADLKRIKHGNFLDDYTLLEELGTGAYSVVYKCQNNASGQVFAAKVTEKVDEENTAMLMREISVLFKVDHPNIIKLFEVYEDESRLYMILEMIKGHELFDRIVEMEGYSEVDAIKITRQLLQAIDYLHSRGIVHRDIKPENLMVEKDETTGEEVLKLLDFGFSRRVETGQRMSTHVGTETYSPPELLTGQNYDNSVDMWSVGVTVYILLSGTPPFWTDHQTEALMKILSASYDFDLPVWQNVSETAKDFIRNTIVANPKRRMTVTQALEHPWITGTRGETPSKKAASVTQLKRYQDERKRLNERNAAYMGEWKDELSSKIQKPGGGKPAGSGPDDGYSLQGKSQRRAWRDVRPGRKGNAPPTRDANYSTSPNPPKSEMDGDDDDDSEEQGADVARRRAPSESSAVKPAPTADVKEQPSPSVTAVISPRSKVPVPSLQLKPNPAMKAIAAQGLVKSASSGSIPMKPVPAIGMLKGDAIPMSSTPDPIQMKTGGSPMKPEPLPPHGVPKRRDQILAGGGKKDRGNDATKSTKADAIPAMAMISPLPISSIPTAEISSHSAPVSPKSPKVPPLSIGFTKTPEKKEEPKVEKKDDKKATEKITPVPMKPLPLSNDKPIPIAAVPSYADGSISPRGRNLEMPSLAQLSAASSAPKSPRKAANDTPERAVKRLVHNMSKLNSLVDDLEANPEIAKQLGPFFDEFVNEFYKRAEKAGLKTSGKARSSSNAPLPTGTDTAASASPSKGEAIKSDKKEKRSVAGGKEGKPKKDKETEQLVTKFTRMFAVLKMFDEGEAAPEYPDIARMVIAQLQITAIKQLFDVPEDLIQSNSMLSPYAKELMDLLKWKKDFKLERLQSIIESAKTKSAQGSIDAETEALLDRTQQDLTRAMTLIGLGVDLGCTSNQILAAKELWRSIE